MSPLTRGQAQGPGHASGDPAGTSGDPPTFRLLETLAVVDGSPRHLALHLDRMRASAATFGFVCDGPGITASALSAACGVEGLHRMRLLLSRDGAVEVQILPQAPPPATLQVAHALTAVDSTHPLLPHKTTQRDHLAAHAVPGADDTLLFNERGELTEFTYGTLVAEIDGRRLTPPTSAGLLPGIERRRALEAGRVTQAVLTLEDVPRAARLWHLNSLRRGWTPVTLPHVDP